MRNIFIDGRVVLNTNNGGEKSMLDAAKCATMEMSILIQSN